MSAGKLTKAQREMLAGFAGWPKHDAPYAGCTNRTAAALERFGFVKWKPGTFFGGRFVITEAGRKALEAGRG